MYTVEFEPDAAVITVLCDNDEQEDVQVIIGDDKTVFIRQFQEYKNEHDIITITYKQLIDMLSAINSPEGAYKVWLTR